MARMSQGFSTGMPAGERAVRGGARAKSDDLSHKRPKPKFSKVWPQVLELMRPRRGVLAFSFLLMIVNRVAGLVLPISSRYLIDGVMHNGNMSLLPKIIAAVVAATLLQGITSYALTQLLSKSGQKLISDLRMKVQAHVGRLPVAYFDENRTGTLVARIMSDVEGVRNLIGTGVVDFIGGFLTAIFVFFYLISVSVSMTLLTFAIVAVFAFVLQRALKVIRPIFRERSKINSEVQGRLTESLGGVRVVKGYNAEDNEARVFADGVLRLLNNVLSSITAQSLMSLASTTVLGVVSALIMFLGAHQVHAHKLTTGQYVSYIALLVFMIAPVAGLVSIGTQLTEALAGLDRTNEVLGVEAEDSAPERTITLPTLHGEVSFDRVQFEYVPGKPVLHGISFEARPGTVTALVGSSGSGKSTIISLICAFHSASAGRVLVDGKDLSKVKLASYRAQLGVVLQETFLFDGTVRENVAFSRPEASEERIMHACRVARVDEFAERFPEGYDTVVGERGVKLSGGQRQRISIARAILADPRILILDEATSSLDSESEAMIQEGLNHLMQGRTTFVIAHRLSTIRRADEILVIEGGNIVERGTHGSLYALEGRYHDLYTRQHGIEENIFLAPGESDAVKV